MRIEGALIMEISSRLIDLVRKPVTGALRRFSVAYLYLSFTRSIRIQLIDKDTVARNCSDLAQGSWGGQQSQAQLKRAIRGVLISCSLLYPFSETNLTHPFIGYESFS
jgi:hypothetical protein